VALSAGTKILQCSPHRIVLLAGETPPLGAVNHDTQNAKEAFDSPMAILEHANRIFEPAVGLCTNLDSHGCSFPSLFSSLRDIVVYSAAIAFFMHPEADECVDLRNHHPRRQRFFVRVQGPKAQLLESSSDF
jgi:hypothetical protein